MKGVGRKSVACGETGGCWEAVWWVWGGSLVGVNRLCGGFGEPIWSVCG